MTRDDMDRRKAEIDIWRQKYEALLKFLVDQQSLMPPRMLADKESYELGRLHGAAAEAQRAAVPEGWKLVPVKPTEAQLNSMAVRYDHGLGVPGYYDSDLFGNATGPSHQQRLDSTIRTMRQLYEEAIGEGFYQLPPPETQG